MCLQANHGARMKYEDFVADIGGAGLTIRAFAELVGMRPNSVSNYAQSQDVPRHLAIIAALLREMNVQGVDYRKAIEGIGNVPKKPRGRSRPGRFGGDKQGDLELGS